MAEIRCVPATWGHDVRRDVYWYWPGGETDEDVTELYYNAWQISGLMAKRVPGLHELLESHPPRPEDLWLQVRTLLTSHAEAVGCRCDFVEPSRAIVFVKLS